MWKRSSILSWPRRTSRRRTTAATTSSGTSVRGTALSPSPTPRTPQITHHRSLPLSLLLRAREGFDFNFQAAHEWYKNVDKLIAAVNADGRVEAKYSTPSIYLAAKASENLTFPLKQDDLFPYSSAPHEYWTGFFTSRPALKRYVRSSSAALQVFRQLEIWLDRDSSATEELWKTQSVAQHHDGVSGTSKQHVAFDYAQRLGHGTYLAEHALYPAFASLVTTGSGAALNLTSCPLANVSVCPASQSSSPFTVLLYNPLAHPRVERVVLPVSSTQLQVVDSTGASVPSDILPVLSTPALDDDAAPYHLSFLAHAPAIGFATYHVTKASPTRRLLGKVQQAVAAATPYQCGQGGGFNISNGNVTLAFGADCVLQSYTGANGTAVPLSHHVGFYYGYQSSTPNVTLDCRGVNSGAYLFRPQTQDKVILPPVNATVVVGGGGVVAEVRITYGSWLHETIRLVNGSEAVEFEVTAGPIPIDDGRGKEIMVTYETESTVPTPAIYTDSNGREFQRRVKDYRPTWNLTTSYEPVSQNFFPINAAAFLTSTPGGLLSLVTDRSQGIASLTAGEMEVMIHRRLFCDDNKGVAGPLHGTTTPATDLCRAPHLSHVACPSALSCCVTPLRAAERGQLHAQPPQLQVSHLPSQSLTTMPSCL